MPNEPDTTVPPSAARIELLEKPEELDQVKSARIAKLAHLQLTEAGMELGLVFQDEYVRVFRDPVRFPSGKVGTYLRIEERAMQNGVAGIVVIPKLGNRIFVHRIFRYPTKSWEWEFPRGFLDLGHSPEEMVHRELAEETGLSVERAQEIGFILSNTGLLAGGAKAFVVNVKPTAGQPTPEEGEAIGDLVAISTSKLWAMVASGEIRDGFTLSAISLALTKQLISPPD